MSQLALLEPEIEADPGPTIAFEIFGEPRPAGSKRAFPFRRKDGSLGVRVTHDNPHAQNWMAAVAQAARKTYHGPLLTGAVALEITFYRPRPAGHFGSGRNAGQLKPSAPRFPTTKPDNTKLRRAIEDAMSGVIYRDDSQIVDGNDQKRYGECYRTVVRIESLDGETEPRF